MANLVSCPSCGTRLRAPENIGKSMIKCPKCANQFVPDAGSSTGAAAPGGGTSKVATAPAGAASQATWYLARNKQKFGPYSFAQLQQMGKSGQLQAADLVVQTGGSQWLPAGTVKGLVGGSRVNGAAQAVQRPAGTSKYAIGTKRTPPRGSVRPQADMAPRSGGGAGKWVLAIVALLFLGVVGAGAAVCGYYWYKGEEIPYLAKLTDKKGVHQGADAPRSPATPKNTLPETVPIASGPSKIDLSDYQRALGAGKFDDADAALKKAEAMAPNDPEILKARAELLKARDDAEKLKKQVATLTDDKKKTEEEQRLRIQNALGDFRAALNKNDLDAAGKALAVAVALAPGNQEVVKAQLDLQEAQTKAAKLVEDKKKLEEAQRTQLQTALNDFRTALAKRDLDAASKALATANMAAPPTNPDIVKAQQDFLEAQKLVLGEDAARKKQMDDAQAKVSEGNEMLALGRYDDAIKAYMIARTLNPADLTIGALIQKAEKARDDARSTAEADLKKKQEEQILKTVAEVRKLMLANDLAAAQKALDAANLSMSTHPDVVRLREDLAKAQSTAQTAAADRQKRLDDAQAKVREGKAALDTKSYDDAVTAFTKAGARLTRMIKRFPICSGKRKIFATRPNAAATCKNC